MSSVHNCYSLSRDWDDLECCPSCYSPGETNHSLLEWTRVLLSQEPERCKRTIPDCNAPPQELLIYDIMILFESSQIHKLAFRLHIYKEFKWIHISQQVEQTYKLATQNKILNTFTILNQPHNLVCMGHPETASGSDSPPNRRKRENKKLTQTSHLPVSPSAPPPTCLLPVFERPTPSQPQ